jgi:Superinfection immunity protein
VHVLSSIAAVIVLADVVVMSGALYLLPVLIGRIRRVPDLGSVAVINVLLGWTLIGWAAALALALRSPRPRAAAVHVVQNVSAPPSWPGQPPGPGWAGPPGAPPARPGVPSPLVLAPRPGGDRDNPGPGERP